MATKKTTSDKGTAAKADAQAPRPRRTTPTIRGVSTTKAKRVSLYLHPDDYEWIRYELRGGDTQAVIRSMIAIARNNQRLANQIALLSRTAPRGSDGK